VAGLHVRAAGHLPLGGGRGALVATTTGAPGPGHHLDEISHPEGTTSEVIEHARHAGTPTIRTLVPLGLAKGRLRLCENAKFRQPGVAAYARLCAQIDMRNRALELPGASTLHTLLEKHVNAV
jgi:hypothetical protein